MLSVVPFSCLSRGSSQLDSSHPAVADGSLCNAHGRRKFRDAEATQPVLAVEGGAFIGAIYGHFARCARSAPST